MWLHSLMKTSSTYFIRINRADSIHSLESRDREVAPTEANVELHSRNLSNVFLLTVVTMESYAIGLAAQANSLDGIGKMGYTL